MSYEKPIILIGNRMQHLLDILDINKETGDSCLAIQKEPFGYYCHSKNYAISKDFYRITKEDIKQIKIIYEITGDRETALYYLFKD